MATLVLEDDEPLCYFCERCGGSGETGDMECRGCDGTGGVFWDRTPLFTLASNLRIAAGLCEAFRYGYQAGVHDGWACPIPSSQPMSEPWRAGCNRPAPGWREG